MISPSTDRETTFESALPDLDAVPLQRLRDTTKLGAALLRAVQAIEDPVLAKGQSSRRAEPDN